MVDDIRFLPAPGCGSIQERETAVRLSQEVQAIPVDPRLPQVNEVGDLKTNNNVSKEFGALQAEITQEYRQIQQERSRLKREEQANNAVDKQLFDQQRDLSKPPAARELFWHEITGYGKAQTEHWNETNKAIEARHTNTCVVSTTFMGSERDLRDVQKLYDQAFQLEKQGKKAEALKLLQDADRTLDGSLTRIKGSSYLAGSPFPEPPLSYNQADRTATNYHAVAKILRDVGRSLAGVSTPLGPALAFGTSLVENTTSAMDAQQNGKPIEQVKAEFKASMENDVKGIAVNHVASRMSSAVAVKIGASTKVQEATGIVVGRVTEGTTTAVGNRVMAGKEVFDKTLPLEIAVNSVNFGHSKAPGLKGVVSTVAREAGKLGVQHELVQVANNDSDSVQNGAR